MGIPKKGSRKFSHEGKNYRYVITSNHHKNDRKDECSAVIQEDTDEGGNILMFDYWNSITPETIKTAIQTGISKGWNPSKKGPAFILGPI